MDVKAQGKRNVFEGVLWEARLGLLPNRLGGTLTASHGPNTLHGGARTGVALTIC